MHWCALSPATRRHSDHRSVIIDVTYRSLIGKERLVVERPHARRLQFTIPSSVTKYVKTLCRLLEEAKFYEQLCSVYSKVTFPISKQVQEQAERLDKLRIDCMLAAERGCRTFRMGEVECSPDLALWGKRIYIWRTILKWHDSGKRTKLSRRNFRKKAKDYGILHPFARSRKQLRRNLIACELEYQRLKDNALKLRLDHLRRRQRLAEDRGDPIAAKGIQILIAREACVKHWR
jgi:hypothetical protein